MVAPATSIKKNINNVITAQESVHDIVFRLQKQADSLNGLCKRLTDSLDRDALEVTTTAEKGHTDELLGR